MKIHILASNLQKSLALVTRAVSTRSQLPILNTILFTVEHGQAMLHATDLEIGIQTVLPATIEDEGKIAIPARIFSELITSLGNEKITLQTQDTTLVVTTRNTQGSIQIVAPDEFPVLYEEKGDVLISLPGVKLQKDLRQVVFAASADTTRPALSGVLIKKTPQELVFAATDGYRLSLQKHTSEVSTQEQEQKQYIVPARVIKEVVALKETGDVVCYVSKKNNQILFVQEETVIIGRLIEGEFPAYEKIVPTTFSTRTTFHADELLRAVKSCAIFAKDGANVISFAITKGKIVVQASSASLGENRVDVEATCEGEENTIAFNARYLLDLLGALGEEEITFSMTGPLNPGVFTKKNDESFLHLIMPIKVQE